MHILASKLHSVGKNMPIICLKNQGNEDQTIRGNPENSCNGLIVVGDLEFIQISLSDLELKSNGSYAAIH